MSASGVAAATAATGGSSKICFNTCCKEPKSEAAPRRKGWRLRSGEFADLCDRCSTSFEQGSFCETFHLDGDGWRKCESCGKRVHCGCIASAQMFALLDAGGIECITCAQKHFVMLPNQMLSPFLPMPSERLKELPVKSWNPLNSTNLVPGQWRQPSNAWSSAVAAQSELHQRLSFEFDRPNSIEKLIAGGRSSILDKNKTENISERLMPGSHNRSAIDRVGNGNHVMKPSAFGTFLRNEGGLDGLQESGYPAGDGDHMPRKRVILTPCVNSSGGIKIEKLSSTCGTPLRPTTLKDESAVTVIGLSSPFAPSFEASDPTRMAPPNQQHCQTHPNMLSKTLYHNASNSVDSSGDSQNQIRNGRPRAEGRGKSLLLPRYWPRITDQELQQISGDSNAVITPLFEKMLSASDAGRIGRLVLPKKCAEAYFPTISQPEGLPLKVQDASGKEWIFQFRFWPNNNSRMYVLEGVTPCIQSMQLQAGDIVTFSRIDPEGKLVMGFRKASNVQNAMVHKAGNGLCSSFESNARIKQGEMIPNSTLCSDKANSEATVPCNPVDQAIQSKFDKPGFIQKERSPASLSGISNKRKNSALGTKSKRLRIDNEESIELKLTWEEAQELLRPPPNQVPTIVLIDGHEFEEYEEAPVLGKPTIFTTNQAGGKDQWAQCEDCLKWRKLPVNALLPPRWTCACNVWDSERSSCLSAQEISQEQLADLLPLSSVAPKRSKTKVHNVIEGADGLDTLANLAILGEGEMPPNPSQPTTKHPRHRPGCSCIVCIQPPSGKGPKHKQTCTCNVCLTVKRRFRTLMLRKEKRQSEKEAETARKKQQLAESPEMSVPQECDKDAGSKTISHQNKKLAVVKDRVDDEGTNKRKEILSPVKTEIDLNMQPEREEDHSLLTDRGRITALLQDAAS